MTTVAQQSDSSRVAKWGYNLGQIKRNGIHPDVFKDKIQGLHQSNTSYLF